MSKAYRRWQDTHCDICGEKLSKAERKYDIKRCADCWEHYDVERASYLRSRVADLEELMLTSRVRVQRVDEMDAVREAKLRKKLAKVKAERDALKAELETEKVWVSAAYAERAEVIDTNRALVAERDALKLQVADMERDRDVWRADANVLRDRWMAAVKVNNALKEERTKLKGDNGDPFTFWKSIVKPDVSATPEPQGTMTLAEAEKIAEDPAFKQGVDEAVERYIEERDKALASVLRGGDDKAPADA